MGGKHSLHQILTLKKQTNVISIVFLNFKNYIQTKVLDKVSTINSICGKHYNIYKLIHL